MFCFTVLPFFIAILCAALGCNFTTLFADDRGALGLAVALRANFGIFELALRLVFVFLLEAFFGLIKLGCDDLLVTTLAVFEPPLAEATTCSLRCIQLF